MGVLLLCVCASMGKEDGSWLLFMVSGFVGLRFCGSSLFALWTKWNKCEKNEQINNNGWMYLFTISYIFSILDSFFLLRNKKKELEESKNTGHEWRKEKQS